MLLTVTRRWFSPVSTCGMLDVDGVFAKEFGYTLEREKPVAIPLGGPYPIWLDQSFHFNETMPPWYLKLGRKVPHIGGVEGRSGLEMHPANFANQLKGCTAVGSEHQEDYLYPGSNLRGGAIFGSDVAFGLLMAKLLKADRIEISFQELTTS